MRNWCAVRGIEPAPTSLKGKNATIDTYSALKLVGAARDQTRIVLLKRQAYCQLYYTPVVGDEGVDPSRCPNLGLSELYKGSPHSRCYRPKSINRTKLFRAFGTSEISLLSAIRPHPGVRYSVVRNLGASGCVRISYTRDMGPVTIHFVFAGRWRGTGDSNSDLRFWRPL